MKLLLSALVLLLVGCGPSPYTPSYKMEYREKLKDISNFGQFTLANDLEVVVIPTKSSTTQFGLTLSSGNLNNPKGKEGLAHLVEHTVLLGSRNYPSPGGLREYIAQNGGSFSAFTGPENTHYLFSIPNSGFTGSIKRFADFLSAPLFKEDVIKNEIDILESEHQRNKVDGLRRVVRIERTLHREDHPIRIFGAGNAATLNSITRDDIAKYFNNYYSANQMKVVVETSLPFEKIKGIMTSSLGQIPNKKNKRSTVKDGLYNNNDLPRETFVKSYKKKAHSLLIFFEVPKINSEKVQQNIIVLNYLLNSKGDGSLYQFLSEQRLISNIKGGNSPTTKRYGGSYMLTFELTELGLQKREEILGALYSYIDFIKSKPLSEELLDSIKKSAELSFIHSNRKIDLNYLLEYSTALHTQSTIDFMQRSLIRNYNESNMNELLQSLSPEKTNLFVLTASPFKATEVEHNVGIEYKTSKLKIKRSKKKSSYKLPEANKMMPTAKEMKADSFKQIVYRRAVGSLLLRYDESIKPIIKLEIKSKHISNSLRERILSEILLSCFTVKSEELLHNLELANITTKLELAEDGLIITLTGINPKITNAPFKIFQKFESSVESCDLTGARERTIARAVQKVPAVPYKRAIFELTNLMRSKSYDLSTVESGNFKITRSEVANHFKNIAKTSIVNIKGLSRYGTTYLKSNYQEMLARYRKGGIENPSFERNKTVILSRGKQYYHSVQIPESKGLAWLTYIQLGKNTLQNEAIVDFLWKVYLNSTFTDEFRRKRKMGYIVGGNVDRAGSELAVNLLIQSETVELKDIITQTNNWISAIPRTITKALPEKRYNQMKARYITSLQDSKPQQAKTFKGLEYKTFIKKVNKMFGEKSRAQMSIYITDKEIVTIPNKSAR